MSMLIECQCFVLEEHLDREPADDSVSGDQLGFLSFEALTNANFSLEI